MKNKINSLILEKKDISLQLVAKEFNIPLINVLREANTVKKYNINKLDELFEILQSWEKVFLLVVTSNFILEIKDRFPKGFYSNGFLNFHDKNSSIGGHLKADKIKEIFLVKDFMFGRESWSIRFYGEDEKEIFSIYVPRNDKKEFIEMCRISFETLYK